MENITTASHTLSPLSKTLLSVTKNGEAIGTVCTIDGYAAMSGGDAMRLVAELSNVGTHQADELFAMMIRHDVVTVAEQDFLQEFRLRMNSERMIVRVEIRGQSGKRVTVTGRLDDVLFRAQTRVEGDGFAIEGDPCRGAILRHVAADPATAVQARAVIHDVMKQIGLV